MTSEARARLSKEMDLFGDDGRLLVFKDDGQLGTPAEGADLAPLTRVDPLPDFSATSPEVSAKVAKANARSRGDIT